MTQRFQWFVCKMLLTFFTVTLVDLVAISLLTHKLRVWFPVWFDAQWATRENAWVVYSQSYFAGIFFIPVLAWKGELMIRYGKQWEAAGWFALTAGIWTTISIAERLPKWLEDMTPRRMLRGLARGVATFFLVMAVIDPLLQIGVQHLDWSRGLLIEVGFFVPAGISLMFAAYKVSPSSATQARPRTASGT